MRLSRHSAPLWIVLVVAAALWSAVAIDTLHDQEAVAARDADQSRLAQVLLTGLVDQETAIRAFANTDGDERYLSPMPEGRRKLIAAAVELRGAVAADPRLRRSLEQQAGLAQRWQRAADARIELIRRDEAASVIRDPRARAQADARMALVDAFRAENASFQRGLAARRTEQASDMTRDAILLVVVLGLALAALSVGLVVRRSRAEIRREGARSELGRALATAGDEAEAHDLIARHLRRDGRLDAVHVLVRDGGTDEVRPADHDDVIAPRTPLRDAVREAGPAGCLAALDGETHRRDGGAAALRRCELCDRVAGRTTCEPLMVGGQTLGAVLAEHRRPLPPEDRRALRDAVRQSAPFLANLRTLARAEAQAATDSLTKLPNRRAIDDALGRLLAQATRSITPLSVIVLDVDHFKRINDTLGHAAGDAALASIGRLLRRLPRASDLAGRWGGEEFVVVLPDTDAAGAARVAEALRTSIAELSSDGDVPPMTASMGVASYPEHAADRGTLLRLADDALYAAKQDGRDRVAMGIAEDA